MATSFREMSLRLQKAAAWVLAFSRPVEPFFRGAYTATGGQAEDLAAVASMMTGSYIGGSVNFSAMAMQHGLKGTPVAAAATVSGYDGEGGDPHVLAAQEFAYEVQEALLEVIYHAVHREGAEQSSDQIGDPHHHHGESDIHGHVLQGDVLAAPEGGGLGLV